MSQLPGEFDIENGVKEYREGFAVRAPGWYKAVLLKDAQKNVKSDAENKFLEVTFQIQDGSNDEIVTRFNIKNKSKKAQAIGRAGLCKVAESVGQTGKFSNTDVLKGRPLMIKLGVEEFQTNKIDSATNALELDPSTGKPKMLKSNVITGYAKVGSAQASVQEAAAPAPESAASAPSTGPDGW